MNYKRLTLLCGHYGSGKTNVAVNMAFELREKYDNVAVADLDIVNPYFRTLDSRKDFEERGIRLICSEYANTNLDVPALPQDMYALTDDKRIHAVLDIGGDDRGAYALGRLTPDIIAENNYDMLCVINCYRPLSRTVEDTMEIMNEIEMAGGIRFTGLVNDSNLGAETTARDVLRSLEYADKISEATGLPIFATAIEEGLFDELKDKIPNLLPMRLQKRPV